MKRVLTFDFGASSGRAIIATYDNGKLDLQEVHRFSNDAVMVNGYLYWDILRLYHEVKQGIIAQPFTQQRVQPWMLPAIREPQP